MKTLLSKSTGKLTLAAKISPDKQKIFVDAMRIGEAELSREDLLAALTPEIPNVGEIEPGVLDEILKNLAAGESVKERRILKGHPAGEGKDGKILLLVKKYTGDGETKIDEKGFASFQQRYLFDNLKTGQAVARIYLPKKGEDGRSALGEALPGKTGKAIKVNLGNGLQREPLDPSNDFELVTASQDGYLVDRDGKLEISDELVIKGDLDFHYGNIEFVGKVVVSGDVMPGFTITARHGIEIAGSMRGKQLACAEGDIIVKGFMHGAHSTKVIAGKRFVGSVVHATNIQACGAIVIGKEAVDCTLRTEDALELNEAVLIGGHSIATKGVIAKDIGAASARATTLELGSTAEAGGEFARLQTLLQSHDKAIQLAQLHLGPFVQHIERVDQLREPHRTKMRALLQKLQEMQESRLSILEEKKVLLEQSSAQANLTVRFQRHYYSGATVKVGDHKFSPLEAIEGPKTISFSLETNEFSIVDTPPDEATKGADDGKKK